MTLNRCAVSCGHVFRRFEAAIAVLALLFAGAAYAQAPYPNKPVKIIVTFTAGGSADFTARLIGDKLTEMWKQQVVVENRIGAGGNIGVEAVFKSPADGYTLLLASSAQPINVALNPKLPFDLFKDFAPIALVTSTPMAVAVHPRMPVKTLAELTKLFQSQPGKFSYATCGVATAHHFAFELYKFHTRMFALHIPYRGCNAAVVETVGGQIDTVISSLNTVLPHEKSGKLRVLAITSKTRSASAPEIPTFAESGIAALKGYAADIYYGFMAPSATPKEILAKLEADVKQVMTMPDVIKRVTTGGLELFVRSSDEMRTLLREDVESSLKIVKFAGIRPE